jgi:hypothetical protein
MKAIHIDFAPRGAMRELASMGPVMRAAAVLAAIVCMGALLAMNDALKRQDAIRAEARQFQAEKDAALEAARSGAREAPITEEQAGAVNNAILQLNLPWSSLLDAIEKATPANVALLELEPDPRRGLVKGVAEAKTAKAMTEYIRHLKQQQFFGNVVLTRHVSNEDAGNRVSNRGAAQGPNKWLRFEFEAEWRRGES